MRCVVQIAMSTSPKEPGPMPRVKEGAFGVLQRGKHVYVWLSPEFAEVRKDCLVEGPLMLLSVYPAESATRLS